MSPSLADGSSGDEVGSWGGPPRLPHVLPTTPSPGRPGTPAAPSGSSVDLWPGLMLGLVWAPRSGVGMTHLGVPDRRSRTRAWLLREEGGREKGDGPRAFSWLSSPLKYMTRPSPRTAASTAAGLHTEKSDPSLAGWQRGVAGAVLLERLGPLPDDVGAALRAGPTRSPGPSAPRVRTAVNPATPARHARLRPDRNKRLPLVARQP